MTTRFGSRRPRPRNERRGNTIVLVAAILTLLAIVSTAFFSRTQAGRNTAAAIQKSRIREQSANGLAQQIADIIARDLFASPVVRGAGQFDVLPGSNWIPGQIDPRTRRHEPDFTDDFNNFTGAPGADRLPDNPWNQPAFNTVPFTNPPDDVFGLTGEGNPFDVNGGTLLHFTSPSRIANPVGNPGFGDSRWLADFEPQRFRSGATNINDLSLEGGHPLGWRQELHDAYSHWVHLSNISRPDNDFRIVRGIDDLFNRDGDPDEWGSLLLDLQIPVEQWPSYVHDPAELGLIQDTSTGDTVFPTSGSSPQEYVEAVFGDWMFDRQRYANAFNRIDNSYAVPPNFMELRDLDGDNNIHGPGEQPDDEFFDPTSMRYQISRFLADADGDGFTDSFWFHVPSGDPGIEQIVAVRVVDNSAKLNVNVATRFTRSDNDERMDNDEDVEPDLFFSTRTIGSTPADLALIGSNDKWENEDLDSFDVGFLDAWHADEDAMEMYFGGNVFPEVNARWNHFSEAEGQQGAQWYRYLREIGIIPGEDGTTSVNEIQPLFPNLLTTDAERRLYWQLSGSQLHASTVGRLPYTIFADDLDDPVGWNVGTFTPFSSADELELTMYYGHNYPWIRSRLESSLTATGAGFSILRSDSVRVETREYQDQLNNRQHRFDLRKRLTTYSGARNDLMPPWLWGLDLDDPAGLVTAAVPYVDKRRFDLRAPWSFDQNDDGFFDHAVFNDPDLDWASFAAAYVAGPDSNVVRNDFPHELRTLLERGFVQSSRFWDPTANGGAGRWMPSTYQSYFGPGNFGVGSSDDDKANLRRTYRMAAALTANITDYRDRELGNPDPTVDGTLDRAVPTIVPVHRDYIEADEPEFYMGMEAQPFLTEAMIGHIYQGFEYDESAPGLNWGEATTGGIYLFRYDESITPTVSNYSSIVVVQLANPFDVAVNLREYRINVFGQTYEILDPTDPTAPVPLHEAIEPIYPDGSNWTRRSSPTATFIAMKREIGEDLNVGSKWFDFLELGDLENDPVNTITTDDQGNVRAHIDAWSTGDRTDYDNVTEDDDGITLERNVNGTWIVVDRFDIENPTDEITSDLNPNRTLTEMVQQMGRDGWKPPVLEYSAGIPLTSPTDNPFGDPAFEDVPGAPGVVLDEEFDGTLNNYWTQWVRITRAWGVDVDGDSRYDDDERSPRYIFADHAITSSWDGVEDGDVVFDPPVYLNGNRYPHAAQPNADFGNQPDTYGGWFRRQYVPYRRGNTDATGADAPFEPLLASPFFFSLRSRAYQIETDGANNNFVDHMPDKGWYGQPEKYESLTHTSSGSSVDSPWRVEFPANLPWEPDTAPPDRGRLIIRNAQPMQMLIKNRDFDQVGELYNVWLFGHGLDQNLETVHTFSEYMAMTSEESEFLRDLRYGTGHDIRVNRLQPAPIYGRDDDGEFEIVAGHVIGGITSDELIDVSNGTIAYGNYLADPRHAMPALPAGVRVMDAFVCDGAGQLNQQYDYDRDGVNYGDVSTPPYAAAYEGYDPFAPESTDRLRNRYDNARGFNGRATPGMINISTAPIEVLRTLPHWYRMVHQIRSPALLDPLEHSPYTRLAEGVYQYRNRLGHPFDLALTDLFTDTRTNHYAPGYLDRGWLFYDYGASSLPGYIPMLRGERGFASPAELQLVNRAGKWAKTNFILNPANPLDQFELAVAPDLVRLQYSSNSLVNNVDNIVNHVRWNDSYQVDFPIQREYDAANAQRYTSNPLVALVQDEIENRRIFAQDPRDASFGANRMRHKRGADLSTDVVNPPDAFVFGEDPPSPMPKIFDPRLADSVAGDVEEANLLYAGASNIVTTRSDTFTVYFRVRRFRQDPNTGLWNALDKDNWVEDSRYVMLVDRSQVNRAADKAKIVYLEKVSN